MSSPLPFPSTSARFRKRRLLPLVLACAIVAVLTAGFWPRAQPVEITTVMRGPLRVTVEDEGMTRVINRYVIAAPVAGQLRRVELKPGAVVEAGATELAVLETGAADLLDASRLAQAAAHARAAAASWEAVAAQVARARAGHSMAAVELGRMRALWEQKTISRQEFDSSEMRERVSAQELRSAEFSLQVAEFEKQQAEAVLLRGTALEAGGEKPTIRIVSPVSGRVLRVFQESTRMVPAGFSLLEVGDPSDLEVRIEVLSRDAVAVLPGARVWLEQWGGSRPLEARVRLVEPSAFTKISALGVEEQRVNVIADLVSPPLERATLGDAYRIEARIVVWENPDVLLASAGALFRRQGGWRIFVVENGRARERTVEVGRSNGTASEIMGGLASGDRVIVYPGDKVTDGRRVRGIEVSVR